MDFNVHDPDGVWIGIIEEPTSAIWTRAYYKPGDFELYTPATAELLDMIAEDCLITRADDDNTVMIVERVELTTDAENGDFVKIKGRSASCMLDRRVVWQQTTFSGRVDRAVYKLIDENAVRPVDPARKLPLSMGVPETLATRIDAQHTGTNLLEATQTLCASHGMGFRVVTDSKTVVNMRVELFVGKDRRAGQTVNSPVIFSPEFENLLSTSYAFDVSKFKNIALVAGEGEGAARKRAVFGVASGLKRRELFVDARDMSTNDGEISADDYVAQLAARGAEKLAEMQVVEAFGGETDTVNTFTLDVDYTVGDIVTVKNEYGIRADTRIIAVSEFWDETGYSTTNTFEGLEG